MHAGPRNGNLQQTQSSASIFFYFTGEPIRGPTKLFARGAACGETTGHIGLRIRLPSPQFEPGFHPRWANLSSMLWLRCEVRIFAQGHVHRAPHECTRCAISVAVKSVIFDFAFCDKHISPHSIFQNKSSRERMANCQCAQSEDGVSPNYRKPPNCADRRLQSSSSGEKNGLDKTKSLDDFHSWELTAGKGVDVVFYTVPLCLSWRNGS